MLLVASGGGGSPSSEVQGWGWGMGTARALGSRGEHALGGSRVPQTPVGVQGQGWLGWPHGRARTGTERRCRAGHGVFVGQRAEEAQRGQAARRWPEQAGY